jgi:hypothetical protein
VSRNLLAIDPGNTESAYVILDGSRLIEFAKVENDVLLARLPFFRDAADELAIEMIASYGMAVGREVFDTCVWIGRFIQAWDRPFTRVYRKDVKLHLCGQPRAKDGNIRQALIDKYGGKDAAIGKKATPGPLYGVSADVWAALAVAVTHSEGNRA